MFPVRIWGRPPSSADIMIILDTKSHINKLLELVAQSESVFISTFGLFAGIKSDGTNLAAIDYKYGGEIYDLLDAVSTKKSMILVGMPTFIECKIACEDCLQKHINACDRIGATANHWPTIRWRFIHNMHAKYYGFIRDGMPHNSIMGGRNLTGSSWDDISVIMQADVTLELWNHFRENFKSAVPINKTNIDGYLDSVIEKWRNPWGQSLPNTENQ